MCAVKVMPRYLGQPGVCENNVSMNLDVKNLLHGQQKLKEQGLIGVKMGYKIVNEYLMRVTG